MIKSDNVKCQQGVWAFHTTTLKTSWRYFLKLNISKDPTISLAGTCSVDKHIYIYSSQEFIRIFIEAPLVIVDYPKLETTQIPIQKKMNKNILEYSRHGILLCNKNKWTIWINLANIMFRERSQTEKIRSKIPFMCNSKRAKITIWYWNPE